jgi:hypothetical protein
MNDARFINGSEIGCPIPEGFPPFLRCDVKKISKTQMILTSFWERKSVLESARTKV